MTRDEAVFVPRVFSHNRARLAEHVLMRRFSDGVTRQAIDAGLAAHEHFVVDCSRIQSHESITYPMRIERAPGPSASCSPGGRCRRVECGAIRAALGRSHIGPPTHPATARQLFELESEMPHHGLEPRNAVVVDQRRFRRR
jgi:hypothetical protein